MYLFKSWIFVIETIFFSRKYMAFCWYLNVAYVFGYMWSFIFF